MRDCGWHDSLYRDWGNRTVPITTLTGSVLLGTSVLGIALNNRKSVQMRRLLKEVFEICKVETKSGGYESEVINRPKVRQIKKRRYGYDINIRLPKGYAVDKFRTKLPEIEEATASKIRMKYLKGRDILLSLGTKPMTERMLYSPSLVVKGELKIPYFTPFGLQYLDLGNETSNHIIIAGATRMGKSVWLRLLFTNIILALDNNVQFFYINNKIEDYEPMRDVIPEPAESTDDAFNMMEEVFKTIQIRKQLIRKARCINAQDYRDKHPEDPMPPVIIVIDEYGRFADSEPFQEQIIEIAETAAYLDVHLVIATQRPDATTVLKPRIRANILTRICFQTADETNSKIVVHTGEAAHLDHIQGRAIILDGIPTIGQIPYVSPSQTIELLMPFRIAQTIEESGENAYTERSDDTEIPDTLPSFVKGSVSDLSLLGNSEAVCDSEPDTKTTVPRRSRNRNSKTEGRVLPLHAKSGSDSHGVH